MLSERGRALLEQPRSDGNPNEDEHSTADQFASLPQTFP
jgi:hypothetical protein